MPQTQANVPVKIAGSDFFSSECNNLNDTINANATDLAEFSLQKDNAKLVTPVTAPPAPEDIIWYVDKTDNSIKSTTVMELMGSVSVNAYDAGAGASIVAVVAPVALPIFNAGFFSSSSVLTDSVGNTGITLNHAMRLGVTATVSIEAAANAEFTFRMYAGGVPFGRDVVVTGAGNNKLVNATLAGVTALLAVSDNVELRVSAASETLVTIDADMKVSFLAAT